jgi:beta-lactam-binding protein with PASTA domain
MKRFFSNIWGFIRSKTFLKHFGIALVSVSLFFWLAFKSLSIYTRHDETVDVPDFTGKKIGELDGFISGHPLKYEIIDSLYDPKKPKGQVVRQDPDAGTKVKEDRTIYLYVTTSVPPKIACPKFIDLSARMAMAIGDSYGLIIDSKTVKADCNGCVIKQVDKLTGKVLEPGTPIEKGTKITIMVGRNEGGGDGDISVPNLVGLSFRAARSRLQDLGLDYTAVPDEPGRKFDTLSSTVYRQLPGPGSDRMLSPGSAVDLFLTMDKSKANDKQDTLDN